LDKIKKLLEKEVLKRNSKNELTLERADPLLVATKYKDEYIALICALFAYGNVNQIIKFLYSLDFKLLNENNDKIRDSLQNHYYRFQKSEDIIQFFITLKTLKKKYVLEDIFYQGYKIKQDVIDGLKEVISLIYDINGYRSRGYEFIIGKIPGKKISSPYKRWNMYLRWMIREDNIDLGLWKKIDKKDLLMPLDTHTFKISQKIGLLKRKTYDFKAVVELTKALKLFDANDPVKYDFAIYRIGQEKLLD
jgi:uncharacterized protein (TIGR02757 family)